MGSGQVGSRVNLSCTVLQNENEDDKGQPDTMSPMIINQYLKLLA